jgi:ATP-binding cassette subfamily B protein
VQVAGAERSVLGRFHQLNEQRRRSTLQHSLISSLIASFNDNIVNLGRALVLLLAARSIASGAFSVGDFALFVVYLEEFLELPRRFGRLLAARKTAEVSSARLVALAEYAPPETLVRSRPLFLQSEAVAPPQIDPLAQLEVKGLSFCHSSVDGAPGCGIEGINLRIMRGSFTVITGRVGAGKSTLLRVLLGLLPRRAGLIAWNGALVADPATFFVSPQVAYTPQAPRLFSGSLRENILLGLPADEREIASALYTAVLEDDVAQMPAGLDTAIGLRGVRLSGGQMQRTAAARMFVRNAELLVFDDLSSALDVETEQKLWERLFARPVRPTCLVVSHRRAALQHASHIVVLKDGKVEDEGTLDELLVRCDEMRRLWHGEITGDSP